MMQTNVGLIYIRYLPIQIPVYVASTVDDCTSTFTYSSHLAPMSSQTELPQLQALFNELSLIQKQNYSLSTKTFPGFNSLLN